jgi:hypothetical protein
MTAVLTRLMSMGWNSGSTEWYEFDRSNYLAGDSIHNYVSCQYANRPGLNVRMHTFGLREDEN